MQNLQLYAYDNGDIWEIQLYDEDPMKLTITAEDLVDIPRVESTFSRQFRVPATQNNSRFFKHWYIAGVLDFDITQEVKAEIHVDGLLYRTGQLRLNAAYVNEDTSNIDYELLFLGETKDFKTQVSEGFLNELNTSDINHLLDEYAIYDSWNQWTGAPFMNGAIRYILAERGYFYQPTLAPGQNTVELKTAPAFPGDNDYTTGEISYQRPNLSFTDINYPIRKEQYTPIIQVSYLIDKIFSLTDYTYSDRSVFSPSSTYYEWFRNLYIDGISQEGPLVPSTPSTVTANVVEYRMDGQGVFERLIFPNVAEFTNVSNSWNPTTNTYTVPFDGANYNFNLSIDLVTGKEPFTPDPTVTIRVMKNGVSISSNTLVFPIDGTNNISLSTGPILLSAGDLITFEINAINNLQEPIIFSTSYFEQTSGPSEVAVNKLMKADVKIMDFFKSILTKFRLVMVPTKDNARVFDVLPWIDYIATGDIFDWTNKLDYSMDVVLKPTFFDQSLVINFEDPEGSDYVNQRFQDIYNYTFGRYLFDSENNLLVDSRQITTIFTPTPEDRLDDSPDTSKFIIPKINQYDYNKDRVKPSGGGSQETYPQAYSIVAKTRLLFWSGLNPIQDLNGYWYDEFAAIGGSPIPVYPCVSYQSEPPYFFQVGQTVNPNAADSIDLTWSREKTNWYEETPAFNSLQGRSVYEIFWDDYIKSLYSPEARIMTAYFKIDAYDLQNLTFDDVIFVRDSYWRVQKIYDAPLTDIDVVKVDLVKLLDYKPAEYTGPYAANEDWGVSQALYKDAGGNWIGG